MISPVLKEAPPVHKQQDHAYEQQFFLIEKR